MFFSGEETGIDDPQSIYDDGKNAINFPKKLFSINGDEEEHARV